MEYVGPKHCGLAHGMGGLTIWMMIHKTILNRHGIQTMDKQ